jgi:hypothetical protein
MHCLMASCPSTVGPVSAPCSPGTVLFRAGFLHYRILLRLSRLAVWIRLKCACNFPTIVLSCLLSYVLREMSKDSMKGIDVDRLSFV